MVSLKIGSNHLTRRRSEPEFTGAYSYSSKIWIIFKLSAPKTKFNFGDF